MNTKKFTIALIGMLLLAGCSSMGPPTIPRDRFDYNGAVAASWKEQTLLNIARMRYVDMPVFLDVSQFIKNLMIPIEPVNIFLLIQAGWPAGPILNLAVQSINGINNQYGGSMFSRGGAPAFYRATALIERLQASNYIGMRVERQKDGTPAAGDHSGVGKIGSSPLWPGSAGVTGCWVTCSKG